MKTSLFGIVITILIAQLFLISCEKRSELIIADSILTLEQQFELIYSIIRYTGHLPSKANHETKFHEEFDEYYMTLANRHKLEFIHQNNKSDIYFLITRRAPSLFDKHVAIGGRVVLQDNEDSIGQPSHYEEIFRTWKMDRSELITKSAQLFSIMIAEGDLSPYYTENSGDEEYIEFPNEYTWFDTSERRWISELDLSISGTTSSVSDDI